MLDIKQRALVEQYAIGAVFSDTAEMGYEALTESLSNDAVPEEVIVWQPYEGLEPKDLLERIEEQYDIFRYFAERLLDEDEAVGDVPPPVSALSVLDTIYRDEQMRWNGA